MFASKIPILVNKIKPGDVIVFLHPVYGTLIKLVERVDKTRDEIFVLGLAEDSIDSRCFGPVHFADVIGKVIGHIGKPGG